MGKAAYIWTGFDMLANKIGLVFILCCSDISFIKVRLQIMDVPESLDTSLSVLDDEMSVLSLFKYSRIGESLSSSGLDSLSMEEESECLGINSISSTLCCLVVDTGWLCSDMYVEEFLWLIAVVFRCPISKKLPKGLIYRSIQLMLLDSIGIFLPCNTFLYFYKNI